MQSFACVHTVGFPKRGTQAPREATQNAQETVAVSKELRDPAFQLMCMCVCVCLSAWVYVHLYVQMCTEAKRVSYRLVPCVPCEPLSQLQWS